MKRIALLSAVFAMIGIVTTCGAGNRELEEEASQKSSETISPTSSEWDLEYRACCICSVNPDESHMSVVEFLEESGYEKSRAKHFSYTDDTRILFEQTITSIGEINESQGSGLFPNGVSDLAGLQTTMRFKATDEETTIREIEVWTMPGNFMGRKTINTRNCKCEED